jgi:hypothetical protein
MKFDTTLRNALVLAGLTAAVALSPARSKAQEITNTQFNDGANVTALAQPTAYQQSASRAALTGTDAVPAGEPIARTQQASVLQVPEKASEVRIITSLLICGSLLALYAFAEARRANRNLRSPRGQFLSVGGA